MYNFDSGAVLYYQPNSSYHKAIKEAQTGSALTGANSKLKIFSVKGTQKTKPSFKRET